MTTPKLTPTKSRVEYISARDGKALAENLGRFLSHINETYTNEAYIDIKPPIYGVDIKWHAFVFWTEGSGE
jgi:hypothetical protein